MGYLAGVVGKGSRRTLEIHPYWHINIIWILSAEMVIHPSTVGIEATQGAMVFTNPRRGLLQLASDVHRLYHRKRR